MLKIIIMSILFSGICQANGLESSTIRKHLAAKMPMMKKCYKDELDKTNRKFKFNSVLNFNINNSGRVEDINIDIKDNADNKYVQATSACLKLALEETIFPKFKGKGKVKVNQTMRFETMLR